MNQIQELEEKIKYHNIKYWEEGNPEITDEEYDILIQTLKNLDPNNKLINSIESPLINAEKIKLNEPMRSLDKVYSIEELFTWCNKVSRNNNELFKIQPKFDGWSAVYDGQYLASKGKSEEEYIGQNISNKIPIIELDTKDYTGSLSNYKDKIRGEIIIRKDIFINKFNNITRKNGEKYKTERSALSGILGLDNVNISLGLILSLVDYDKYSYSVSLENIKTLDWNLYINNLKNSVFPIDGVVIKLADEEYSNSLGFTSHHPKGQIALKLGNPSGISILKDVILSSGKNKLTPVGIIDPVIIAGHEIKKVNLHNWKFILDKHIRIGDTLIIERCGEIIPHVKEVLHSTENIKPINVSMCPFCNSQVYYIDPELKCSNEDCSGMNINKLHDSIKRIGIENIGPAIVEQLLENDIKNLVDLFNIEKETFLNFEKFADKKSENTYNEIQSIKNKEIEDWRVLSSLNIHGIGTSFSKKLLNLYTLQELRNLPKEDLINIPDMGPERSNYLYTEFIKNENYLNNLLNILKVKTTKNDSKKKLGTICFTGSGNRKRDDYVKLSEELGFTFVSTARKDLTILVCSDPNSGSSKLQKAMKNGTKIISYDDFEKILNNNNR